MESVVGEQEVEVYEVDPQIVNISYEEKLKYVNAISFPIASRKLAKRLYRLIKATSASKIRTLLRQGVKDVQKFIRRGEKGIVILAGNVTPIDTYSHVPVVCEQNSVRYVFVPCMEDIQLILGSRMGCQCLMVNRSEGDENSELFDKCAAAIDAINFTGNVHQTIVPDCD